MRKRAHKLSPRRVVDGQCLGKDPGGALLSLKVPETKKWQVPYLPSQDVLQKMKSTFAFNRMPQRE